MKEKIEAKVNEIIDYIIAKEPKDITVNDYFILDSKLQSIKYEEDQVRRNKDMAEMTAKIFSGSSNIPSSKIPVNGSDELV